jgi:ABC-2 type transport system permease protein
VADVLTGGRLAGDVGDTTRVLVGMRRSLTRNSAGRSGTQLAGAGIGAILAVGTLLLGLVALAGLLLLAWAALLQRNMRKGGGRTARVGRRWAGRQAGRFGLLPATPTGAVVGKELRAWRRDAERTQTLLLALLVSVLNLAVPVLAWGARSLLLWVGLVAAMLASLRAGNSYGDDGTALWLTRMTPGTERADVRGRQAAWLLAVAPVMVVLTVALTALSGEGWAWPLAGAALPAVLAGPRASASWSRWHGRSGRRIPTGVPARSTLATTRTPRVRR